MPGSIGELPCAYVRFNASTWCLHMPCAGGVSEPATLVTDLLLALAFALAAASLACQHRGVATLLTRARAAVPHAGVGQRVTAAWACSLGIFALSFAAGGLEHGLAP